MKKSFTIHAKLWKYSGENSAWHFISLDKDTSAYIKSNREPKPGFGSIKAGFTIGKTTWNTSLFPSKSGVYDIPIKASVRKSEVLKDGDEIKISFKII
jgi:hypothetical protein